MKKETHWSKQNEKGTPFSLHLTRLLVRHTPLPLMRLIALPISLYYFLSAKNTRLHLKTYHQHLKQTNPHLHLPRYARLRQIHNFANAIIDRFAIWQQKITLKHLIIDDKDKIIDDMRRNNPKGQLLICAHLGNTEIARAMLKTYNIKNFKLNILIHSHHATHYNQALKKAGAETLNLIEVQSLNAQKMLELQEKLAQGEWIAIAADRTPIKGDKTLKTPFLKENAHFPQGPWLIAYLLKAPTNTLFCLKEKQKYRIKLRRFSTPENTQHLKRQEFIQQHIENYAKILEQQCLKTPLHWFNFYNFWQKNPDEKQKTPLP